MFRSIVAVLMYLTITTAAAAGQQTIGVSATVLERVEAAEVELEIRSVRGGLKVQEAARAIPSDSRLLQSTFVTVTGDEPVVTVPVRIHEGGIVRLERRPVRTGAGAGEELGPGESVLLEGVEGLTVTRVVASNS